MNVVSESPTQRGFRAMCLPVKLSSGRRGYPAAEVAGGRVKPLRRDKLKIWIIVITGFGHLQRLYTLIYGKDPVRFLANDTFSSSYFDLGWRWWRVGYNFDSLDSHVDHRFFDPQQEVYAPSFETFCPPHNIKGSYSASVPLTLTKPAQALFEWPSTNLHD